MIKNVIRIIGMGFCLGGVIHWLIIIGVMEEKAPFAVSIYFHSLAILSPLAGIGLFTFHQWGRRLGLLISITQIPSHLFMIWIDHVHNRNSGLSLKEREFDIIFAIFYLIFFNLSSVKKYFVASITVPEISSSAPYEKTDRRV